MKVSGRFTERQTDGVPDIAGADVRELVEHIVREELQHLLAGADRLERTPSQSDVLPLVQWLAPFLRETILDALRLGLSLNASDRVEPLSAGGSDTPAGLPPAADFDAVLAVARSGGLAKAAEPAPDNAPVVGPLNGPLVEHGVDGVPPALLSGHMTLLVSPFDGFAEVQRFLHDLSSIPRIFDVKPKRFTGGRLYITFGTEHSDSQALAGVLATELEPYRLVLRSVQHDFLEFLLRPSASAIGQ